MIPEASPKPPRQFTETPDASIKPPQRRPVACPHLPYAYDTIRLHAETHTHTHTHTHMYQHCFVATLMHARSLSVLTTFEGTHHLYVRFTNSMSMHFGGTCVGVPAVLPVECPSLFRSCRTHTESFSAPNAMTVCLPHESNPGVRSRVLVACVYAPTCNPRSHHA